MESRLESNKNGREVGYYNNRESGLKDSGIRSAPSGVLSVRPGMFVIG